ncbi:MAG: 2,3,4,5-tetrahydropyridine-2,6-dicarboxylate N-succinyltransferase, partial [Bosea sp. (in: a-proteobacteria)]
MNTAELARTIEAAWDDRANVSTATKGAVRDAVVSALGLLDDGKLRVAEKVGPEWITHQWLKKAVLLSFRLNDNVVVPFDSDNAGSADSPVYGWDKVQTKTHGWGANRFRDAGFRMVPGAVVRQSAFIAKNVVLMPSFVNVGARVDEGTMVDTWATVGSCAQIGKNVHLSGGV